MVFQHNFQNINLLLEFLFYLINLLFELEKNRDTYRIDLKQTEMLLSKPKEIK